MFNNYFNHVGFIKFFRLINLVIRICSYQISFADYDRD